MILSAVTGILSSWGIGGGTLLLIIMTSFLGIDSETARSVNLLYFFPASVGSVLYYIRQKMINRKYFLLCISFGIPSAVICAIISFSISGELMHKLFGCYLVFIGIKELIKKDDR